MDFLLVLVGLFSLGVTAEVLRANIGSKSAVDPKFQVEGVAPTNHSFTRKTRLNDLSCGVKIWTIFFSFVTIHTFDRQTDEQKDTQSEFSSLDRVCIPCSAVKTRIAATARRYPMN